MEKDDDVATEELIAPVTENDESMATVAPKAPDLARAVIDHDVDNPKGTEGHSSNGMSVFQQLVAFFDDDNDGIIYPNDTYNGMHNVGLGRIASLALAVIIHVLMSYATLPGWKPDLKLPIYVARIHKAKHGSDSATFDTEGSEPGERYGTRQGNIHGGIVDDSRKSSVA